MAGLLLDSHPLRGAYRAIVPGRNVCGRGEAEQQRSGPGKSGNVRGRREAGGNVRGRRGRYNVFGERKFRRYVVGRRGRCNLLFRRYVVGRRGCYNLFSEREFRRCNASVLRMAAAASARPAVNRGVGKGLKGRKRLKRLSPPPELSAGRNCHTTGQAAPQTMSFGSFTSFGSFLPDIASQGPVGASAAIRKTDALRF